MIGPRLPDLRPWLRKPLEPLVHRHRIFSILFDRIAARPARPRSGGTKKGLQNAPFCFDRAAHIGKKPRMAKKPGTNPKGEFAFFNVVYEDGSQRSNRRVPAELLGGLEGDEPARGFIMEQDREIAEKSGRPPLAIKEIERVGAKKR
jgi:hypothetical protein